MIKTALAFLLRPGLMLTLLVLTQLAISSFLLKATLDEPERREWFLHGDTGTYLGIADRFLHEDYSMSFVAKRPHRVPLFPAALALGLWAAHGDLIGLAAINVLIGCLIVAAVYGTTLSLLENRLAAALMGIACLCNKFLIEFNTQRLMTEPLYILLAICASYFFVTYARKHRTRDLCWMSVCCALCYLTRVNGLFLLLAAFGILFTFDVVRLLQGKESGNGVLRALARLLGRHSIAFVLALAITALNWWPRWHYFGNPIAHGYPTNYLWVDKEEQGTTGLPYPTYGLKDYRAAHTFHDFLIRWKTGIYRVYETVPIRTEIIPVQYWLAVAGILVSLARRKWEFVLLTGVMIAILLPSAWTYVAVPVWRIPYSSFLPFEFVLSAVALDFFLGLRTRRISNNSTPEQSTSPP